MADCINEITGVQIISLYPSDRVTLIRPDISNENEVNLISDGEDSYIISDPVLLPKWERILGYSGNYKQNYLDEFTFLAFGIENEIPAIIKELRNTRVGYVVEIKTIGDSNYVFQSPVFLNNANTKQIDSHSWQVSLSYRIPSFLDKLTNLETILGTASEVLPCDKEIQGVQSISLYINEDILYIYPDITNENEVNIYVPEDAFLVVDQVKELPKWERIINYSKNYKQNYNDEFAFLLHGIENDVPETIKTLRNNRVGYIVTITTTSNKDYVFQTPIFLNENNTKQVDSHSWAVSLAYRVPSFDDKLTLLNTFIGIPVPTDAIHYWAFENNVLDTGSVGNDLTIVNGVIADIMTSDRKGNPDSAYESSNIPIYQTVSVISLQKGWSFNWWQNLAPATNNNLFYATIARFIRFIHASKAFNMRPTVGGAIEIVCADYLPNIWQNIHCNYGNGTVDVYIDNVFQGSASNVDHTIPLNIARVCSYNSGSDLNVKKDDVQIFDRLLSSDERQAIADS